MMIHPSVVLAQSFSCSSCLPGTRKQIGIISITVVYKLFSFWFPTWKPTCWHWACTIPLPNSSMAVILPQSAPLYALRSWKESETRWAPLRFGELLLNSDFAHALWHTSPGTVQDCVVLVIHAGTWWRLSQLLSLLCIEVSIAWKRGASSSNRCRCHWVMVTRLAKASRWPGTWEFIPV